MTTEEVKSLEGRTIITASDEVANFDLVLVLSDGRKISVHLDPFVAYIELT